MAMSIHWDKSKKFSITAIISSSSDLVEVKGTTEFKSNQVETEGCCHKVWDSTDNNVVQSKVGAKNVQKYWC